MNVGILGSGDVGRGARQRVRLARARGEAGCAGAHERQRRLGREAPGERDGTAPSGRGRLRECSSSPYPRPPPPAPRSHPRMGHGGPSHLRRVVEGACPRIAAARSPGASRTRPGSSWSTSASPSGISSSSAGTAATWPASGRKDYWPESPAPPSPRAWKASLEAVAADRKALQEFLATTPDLFAEIPGHAGKTILRSVLLAIDHTSYHVGQLLTARKLLGA